MTQLSLQDTIQNELKVAKRCWCLWFTLDIIFVVLGIAAPAIAAYWGAKSIADGKAALPALSAKPNKQKEEGPPPGWVRTCGWMAVFALVGTLATGLHKGLNIEQHKNQANKRKVQLSKIDAAFLHEPDFAQIHKDYINAIDNENVVSTDEPK